MKTFNLDIVTPERIAYSEQVDLVSVPSSDGELTILPEHIPLFASLAEGEVKIRRGAEDFFLSIGGGFIEVTSSKTTLLVSRAYKAEELNEQAILKAQKEAEEALARGDVSDEERMAAHALLRSTLVDLKVVRRRKRYNV